MSPISRSGSLSEVLFLNTTHECVKPSLLARAGSALSQGFGRVGSTHQDMRKTDQHSRLNTKSMNSLRAIHTTMTKDFSKELKARLLDSIVKSRGSAGTGDLLGAIVLTLASRVGQVFNEAKNTNQPSLVAISPQSPSI